MKDLNDWIESMVKITYVEQSHCFGHYPFQMFEEKEDGQNVIIALALGGQVKACFSQFSFAVKSGAKRVYMAIDFPKSKDFENDFIAVFSWENEKLELIAIPYNEKTGDVFSRVEKHGFLDLIKNQLVDNFLHMYNQGFITRANAEKEWNNLNTLITLTPAQAERKQYLSKILNK